MSSGCSRNIKSSGGNKPPPWGDKKKSASVFDSLFFFINYLLTDCLGEFEAHKWFLIYSSELNNNLWGAFVVFGITIQSHSTCQRATR